MRDAGTALGGLGVVVAGIVLGSGVSGYASAPANDPCFSSGGDGGPEMTTSYSWAPFGTRCLVEHENGTREVLLFASSTPAWIGWIVAMTALVAWLARRHDNAAAAGAIAAAVLLTVCGVAAHNGTDFIFTTWAAMGLGTPAVAVTLHLLTPREHRSWQRTVLLTILFMPVVYVVSAVSYLADLGHVGVVASLLAGAAISAWAPRLRWLIPPVDRPV